MATEEEKKNNLKNSIKNIYGEESQGAIASYECYSIWVSLRNLRL